jgi:hypothetical protein
MGILKLVKSESWKLSNAAGSMVLGVSPLGHIVAIDSSSFWLGLALFLVVRRLLS